MVDADVEYERLIDFICEHDNGIQFALEHKDLTVLEDIFFEYLETQKVAYNVDNVVEQLHRLRTKTYPIDNGFRRGAKNRANWMLNTAIEIVKRGGIDEGI